MVAMPTDPWIFIFSKFTFNNSYWLGLNVASTRIVLKDSHAGPALQAGY